MRVHSSCAVCCVDAVLSRVEVDCCGQRGIIKTVGAAVAAAAVCMCACVSLGGAVRKCGDITEQYFVKGLVGILRVQLRVILLSGYLIGVRGRGEAKKLAGGSCFLNGGGTPHIPENTLNQHHVEYHT